MTNEYEITNVSDVNENDAALMELDYDNIHELAERADRMVTDLKKIMNAAIAITTPKDWCLIGGEPYLQETGASKVARLFGISWKICEGYPQVETSRDGYPTYTYRMIFRMGRTVIEAEGMRCASDEFFIGKAVDKFGNSQKQKSVDEVDLADVKRSAYTNCLNRGIKGILPGLRKLELSDLEAAGVHIERTSGYTFKTGSKGGNTGKAEDSGLLCSKCGKAVDQSVASYSQGKFGAILCIPCQRSSAAPSDKGGEV